ncbi:hypothetical protein V22_40830 [Calycomorphotria hydatis]|uniref:Uncharacterized protein n=1 Tax=Calycomorphotria hydatis TaxID=2528027 RepID=A0A517TEL3_9PLAN|nr:hypothetical protein V22_40830 [Calycomorphotria hydatis]
MPVAQYLPHKVATSRTIDADKCARGGRSFQIQGCVLAWPLFAKTWKLFRISSGIFPNTYDYLWEFYFLQIQQPPGDSLYLCELLNRHVISIFSSKASSCGDGVSYAGAFYAFFKAIDQFAFHYVSNFIFPFGSFPSP